MMGGMDPGDRTGKIGLQQVWQIATSSKTMPGGRRVMGICEWGNDSVLVGDVGPVTRLSRYSSRHLPRVRLVLMPRTGERNPDLDAG